MNIAQTIISALAFAGCPVVQQSYAGDEETYIVFRLDHSPSDFANDSPQHDVVSVSMHLFAPFTFNTKTMRKRIRKSLFDAGFTYPETIDVSSTQRTSDGTEQHIVFEFEIAEGIDDV